jgi:hypothetical protein
MSDFHSTKRTTNFITPVCEEKSNSYQLIYIHEGHTPYLNDLRRSTSIFNFKFCGFGGGEGSGGKYASSPAE